MNNLLEEIDRIIVVTINGWNTPLLDEIMWSISSKIIWIPLYLFLIFLALKRLNVKQTLFFTLLGVLSVVAADLISNYGFKEVFQRFRPSHNLILSSKLHLYEIKSGEFYRGGLYGFISSHSANFFAFSTFVGLALKAYYPKLLISLLTIASLVSLSRIYLGVHYFSDVLIGGIVGGLIAYLIIHFLYFRFIEKIGTK